MVAVGALSRDYELVSEAMSFDAGITRVGSKNLRRLTVLLEPAELDLTESMRSEFLSNARFFLQVRERMRASLFENPLHDRYFLRGFLWPLYQPNDTVNAIHEDILTQSRCLGLPAAEFAAMTKGAANGATAKCDVQKPFRFDFVYNPIGKYLMLIGPPNYRSSALRTHDLDAYVRLVRLQMVIVAAGLSDDQIGPFLERTGPELANPYTGKPMDWDPVARRLWFQPLGTSRLLDVDIPPKVKGPVRLPVVKKP